MTAGTTGRFSPPAGPVQAVSAVGWGVLDSAPEAASWSRWTVTFDADGHVVDSARRWQLGDEPRDGDESPVAVTTTDGESLTGGTVATGDNGQTVVSVTLPSDATPAALTVADDEVNIERSFPLPANATVTLPDTGQTLTEPLFVAWDTADDVQVEVRWQEHPGAERSVVLHATTGPGNYELVPEQLPATTTGTVAVITHNDGVHRRYAATDVTIPDDVGQHPQLVVRDLSSGQRGTTFHAPSGSLALDLEVEMPEGARVGFVDPDTVTWDVERASGKLVRARTIEFDRGSLLVHRIQDVEGDPVRIVGTLPDGREVAAVVELAR